MPSSSATPTTVFFAYAAAAYIGACLLYLVGSPLAGRPWADYLRRLPREALQIRGDSGRRRATLFAVSVALSIAVLLAWRPFGSLSDAETSSCSAPPPTVCIKTSKGDIDVELRPDVAPNHVDNFVALAQSGYYDGTTFHRVIKGFMIQGGDPKGDGTGGNTHSGEPLGLEPGLEHTRGTLSMARSHNRDSAGSQFFLVHKDSHFLDGAYSGFGRVTRGLDVVDAIASVETNEKNDKPTEPVIIETIAARSSANASI